MTAMNTSGKRQIKASEIKEGMTIQLQMEVDFVREHRDWPTFFRDDGRSVGLDGDIEVEVLSESQPEEPTAFGARVIAGGRRFVRGNSVVWPWIESLGGELYDWRGVCDEGEVTIIDADPSWTLPAQVKVAPVVPERIEEWPEGDEHLRPYRWRDRDGDLWYSISDSRTPWVVGFADRTGAFHPYPKRGPFTRVTDA